MKAHTFPPSASHGDDTSDDKLEFEHKPIDLPFPEEGESMTNYIRRLFIVLTQRDARAEERENRRSDEERGA